MPSQKDFSKKKTTKQNHKLKMPSHPPKKTLVGQQAKNLN